MVEWLRTKGGQFGGQKQADAYDSDENHDDEMDDIPKDKVQQKKVQRAGVSAEVYGTWNKKEDFKPRVIAKTDE